MAIKEPATFVHSIQGIAQVSVRTSCPKCKSKTLTYVNNIVNPDALQTRWVVCDKCKHEFLDKYYGSKITDNEGNDITEKFTEKRKEYHGSLVFGYDQ